MTTWTSLRRPLLKVGRSGRSIRRQVRMASSDRAALAAEERAGDPARGVHPLLDVDREREEVEVVLRVLAGRGGRQQHGVVVEVGGHRAGGLLAGEAAGLELDGAGAELAVVDDGLYGVDLGSLHGVPLSCRRLGRSQRSEANTRGACVVHVVVHVCCRCGQGRSSIEARGGPAPCARSRRPLPRTGPDVRGRSWVVLHCSVVEPVADSESTLVAGRPDAHRGRAHRGRAHRRRPRRSMIER